VPKKEKRKKTERNKQRKKERKKEVRKERKKQNDVPTVQEILSIFSICGVHVDT
jgi:hypothetical protein